MENQTSRKPHKLLDGKSKMKLPYPFNALVKSDASTSIVGPPFQPEAIVETEVTIARIGNQNKITEQSQSLETNVTAAAATAGKEYGLKAFEVGMKKKKSDENNDNDGGDGGDDGDGGDAAQDDPDDGAGETAGTATAGTATAGTALHDSSLHGASRRARHEAVSDSQTSSKQKDKEAAPEQKKQRLEQKKQRRSKRSSACSKRSGAWSERSSAQRKHQCQT